MLLNLKRTVDRDQFNIIRSTQVAVASVVLVATCAVFGNPISPMAVKVGIKS